jgi:hypothetical protein
VSSSTGSAVSEEATLGFIDEFVPLSGPQLVAWRRRRTSEIGCVLKDVTSSPVDIILVERLTPRSSNLPCPMLTRAMSIPTERLNTHLYDSYWHSSKPRSTHLATQPRAAQRQGELDTYGLHPPPICPLLPSPMATRHIIPRSSPRFLTRARLCPARRSTITNCIVRSQRRRCQSQRRQPQSRPRSCPRDTRMVMHIGTENRPRLPLRTLRRPKPLFTTAKTGAGISKVFVYVARRVVMRCEWEEAHATGPILSETAALFILVAL